MAVVMSPAMSALSDYELGETLGQGAFGRTVAATHKASGRDVAVKILRLAGLPDWKPVELLEREAKVLRSLVHPGIPAFVEAFEDHGDAADESGERAEVQLCIVTERVAGETLAAKLARGDRWTTAQAERLTRELLETLAYLRELSPPVVHRDVTPGNVMIDEGGRAMLVDFGAVRSLSHQPGQAQTVLGTPGYMAPEQAMGEATPASDLYGLGTTLAHVLTHQHPSQLPREGLRISVEGLLGDAGAVGGVLPGLLAPEASQRFASARAALAVLDGAAQPPSIPGAAAPPATGGATQALAVTGAAGGDAATQALAVREAAVMQALATRRPTGEEGADKLLRHITSPWLGTDARSSAFLVTTVGVAVALASLPVILPPSLPLLAGAAAAIVGLGALGVAGFMRRYGARVRAELKGMLAEGTAVPGRRVKWMARQVNAYGAPVGGSGMLARQDLVRFEWHGETSEVPLPYRLRAHRGPLVVFLKDGVEQIYVLSDTEVQELLDADVTPNDTVTQV